LAKLVIVYASGMGTTKAMAEAIEEGARSAGVETVINNAYDAIPEELAQADGVALGSSTYEYKMLKPMETFLDKLKTVNLKGKIGAAFGAYGWSGEAPGEIADRMRSYGIEVIEPIVKVKYEVNEESLEECRNLGKLLAEKIKK